MIRQAVYNDIPNIMKFIDTYWKKNHILAADRDFFEYEYYVNGDVNFIISLDEENHLEGIMGFIRYDRSHRDIINALWKVRDNVNKPMLGVQLLQYVIKNCADRLVASPGINIRTIPVYKYLKYYTDKMGHYYRLNSEYKDFKIAKIVNRNILPCNTYYKLGLLKFNNFNELADNFSFIEYTDKNIKPYKESWYIKKRYFNHPYYHYEKYGIIDNEKGTCQAILFFRKVAVGTRSCLRLVDIIGDYKQLKYVGRSIDKLIQMYDCEYCDLYCTGVPEDVLKEAGFLDRYETNNIIPNYFEPYLQENIDIWYFTTDNRVVLFKADGDQDRPSIPRIDISL